MLNGVLTGLDVVSDAPTSVSVTGCGNVVTGSRVTVVGSNNTVQGLAVGTVSVLNSNRMTLQNNSAASLNVSTDSDMVVSNNSFTGALLLKASSNDTIAGNSGGTMEALTVTNSQMLNNAVATDFYDYHVDRSVVAGNALGNFTATHHAHDSRVVGNVVPVLMVDSAPYAVIENNRVGESITAMAPTNGVAAGAIAISGNNVTTSITIQNEGNRVISNSAHMISFREYSTRNMISGNAAAGDITVGQRSDSNQITQNSADMMVIGDYEANNQLTSNTLAAAGNLTVGKNSGGNTVAQNSARQITIGEHATSNTVTWNTVANDILLASGNTGGGRQGTSANVITQNSAHQISLGSNDYSDKFDSNIVSASLTLGTHVVKKKVVTNNIAAGGIAWSVTGSTTDYVIGQTTDFFCSSLPCGPHVTAG